MLIVRRSVTRVNSSLVSQVILARIVGLRVMQFWYSVILLIIYVFLVLQDISIFVLP